MSFSSQTSNKLRYYVYVLVDPRQSHHGNEEIFYVGKGKGQRCFAHARLNKTDPEFPKIEAGKANLKLDRIQLIINSGGKPRVIIVAHGFDVERDALNLEAILIKGLRVTNKQAGHHSDDYWLSQNQLEDKYGVKARRNEVSLTATGSVVLVSLNKTYVEAKTDPELLKYSTLGSWNINPGSAKKVRLVIGVYRSVMVSFYRTKIGLDQNAVFQTYERQKPRAHNRIRWDGEFASDLHEGFFERSLQSDDNPSELTNFLGQQRYKFI